MVPLLLYDPPLHPNERLSSTLGVSRGFDGAARGFCVAPRDSGILSGRSMGRGRCKAKEKNVVRRPVAVRKEDYIKILPF